MNEENKIPELGTPEYDEYMLKQHEDNEARFKEEPEPKTDPRLPEGVSMDDLLALWREKNQPEQKPTDEAAESKPEDKQEENSEKTPEGESELDQLRRELQELKDQQVMNQVMDAAGGKEAFEQLRTNAEQVLDETQLGLLNMALVEGTPDQAVAAVKMMRMLFDANPEAPNFEGQRLSGSQSTGTEGYATEADFHAALQNPLYRDMTAKGEAYRQQVEAKLARSSF